LPRWNCLSLTGPAALGGAKKSPEGGFELNLMIVESAAINLTYRTMSARSALEFARVEKSHASAAPPHDYHHFRAGGGPQPQSTVGNTRTVAAFLSWKSTARQQGLDITRPSPAFGTPTARWPCTYRSLFDACDQDLFTGEAGLVYCNDGDVIAALRCMENFGFGEPRSATMRG